MVKVLTEIEGCTGCSGFSYTVHNGCVCEEVGLDKMIEDETYVQFNKDFHSGKLFEFIPEWCPKREK